MATASIRVFGGIGVDHDGQPVNVGGARQRRLLALLTIRHGRVVDLDWLAEYLWDDAERPEATAPAIRTYLSRLRQALPPEAAAWIATEAAGYRLAAPDDAIETVRVRTLRSAAREARDRGDPQAASGLLAEAAALLRGRPYRELDDLDWARAEIERLEVDRLELAEERWEVALELGRHTQITGELAAFTVEHATRDRAVRQYALALHRSGRTADALREIDRHRRALADESGLDPSAAMIELEDRLLAGDPSLELAPAGRPLRGYQLIEEIGAGAFSVVWRAMQPSVGREVAIKQIRSELATQPDFIRRFEAEARLVARLEHPNIVPLVDYWRDPESAYLVMRWLRGGTLERRLDDGPMSLDDTLTMAGQIAGALSMAHRHHVVHRDVKPANILFDEDGRAYLTDFGIALDAELSAGPDAALSPGSPVYSAPEQVRRERSTPAADVYSLAVVVGECLSGRSPVGPDGAMVASPDVPPAVRPAIERALSPDPADRFVTVEAFVGALTSGDVDASTPDAVGPDVDNPYPGLVAFDDGDDGRFFGRDRLVAEMLGRWSGSGVGARSLIVTGPSGSGKSSVVRAGLLPALRAGAQSGTDRWFVATMLPGADPFAALAEALLSVAVRTPESILDELRSGERGIVRAARRCLADDGPPVLIVIDQFEELFTMGGAFADAFLAALAVAVEDPTSPVRLVATLRADHYHRPLAHPTFARVLKEAALDVTPLAGDELEQAIVAPARRLGVEFESGLVARIATEASNRPGALPLLQHALRELFDRRDGATLTVAAYDEIGGLTGALSSQAEAMFVHASAAQQEATRAVFGRLAGGGFDGESLDVRRRVRIGELVDSPETSWVLDTFGAARLLTFDRDVRSREPTVEVAHEALLREWPRLATWLREDAELIRAVDDVSMAAAVWDDGGRRAGDLARGVRLDRAGQVLTAAPERLRDVDRDFVEASLAEQERLREAERRSVTRLRRLLGAVAIALVVAMVAGGLAWRQQRRANDEAAAARAAEAEARSQAAAARAAGAEADAQAAAAVTAADEAELATLISRSASVAVEEPELGILLALEAAARAPGPVTEQAVLNALGTSNVPNKLSSLGPPWGDDPTCEGVALMSADGTSEFAVRGGELVRRDVLTGEVERAGAPPTDGCPLWMSSAALDRKFAISFEDSLIWTAALDGAWSSPASVPEGSNLFDARHNPSGRLLLSSVDESIVGSRRERRTRLDLVDDLTGTILTTIEEVDVEPWHAGLDPSGELVGFSFGIPGAELDAGRLRVYEAATGDALGDLTTSLPVPIFDFDGSGQLIAAELDGALTTFDLETFEPVARLAGVLVNEPYDVEVLDDARVVVALPGEIGVFDRRSGQIGNATEVRNIDGAWVRPDGRIAVLTDDGRTEVIDVSGNALVERSLALPAFANIGQRDGLVAAVVPPGGVPQRIDLATGERVAEVLARPDGSPFPAIAILPEPDGFWVVGPGNELVRFEDGAIVERLEPRSESDGGRIEEGFVALFDRLPDGSARIRMVALERGALRVTFSTDVATREFVAEPTRDGGLYVLTEDGTLRIHDPAGDVVEEVATGVTDGTSINPDPSGPRIAVPTRSGGIVLIDGLSGDTEVVSTTGEITNATFTDDGRFLALIDAAGTVRIWDVERGESAGLVWNGSGSVGGQLSWYDDAADELWVQTSGRLIAVPLDPERWIERACEVVGRAMTPDEWDRLVPGGGEPVDRCANPA